MDKIKITERGWAGHFICADRCLFRRNTLIEYLNIKIVVSTVGNMVNVHAGGWPNTTEITTVGLERYFETMAFHADPENPFLDADVSKHVSFDSVWAINEPWKELEANTMHDNVVSEISTKLALGKEY